MAGLRNARDGSNDARPLIFVVDGDDSARRSLEPLLRTEGWRTAAFACAQEFLAHPRTPGACCLVTEVALPDIDGLELQQRLADGGHATPIVFVTRCGDIATTVRAMKAGAVDFITKPFATCELVAAVSEAIERSEAGLRQREEMRDVRERYESLTPRERDVMAGAVSGRLNKQIAADLDISEITVKAHRGRMMRKMYARSLAALVDIAGRLTSAGVHCRRYGLVEA